MAIYPQTAALILRENKHRPIAGDVLFIGHQTVVLNEKSARGLLRHEDIQLRPGWVAELDRSTVAAGDRGYLTDRSFVSMFADCSVKALDVSPYEGAEIVHDLNEPLPDEHCGIADFIFNGSCLDDLFDPATAIKSMSKMLRPGGRIMHLEMGSQTGGQYLCYSPEWFFDFYALNGYLDCQVLQCVFPFDQQQPWHIFRWLPFIERNGEMEPATMRADRYGHFVNIVIAEKGSHSTDVRAPIRASYRNHHGSSSDVYRRSDEAYRVSTRRFDRIGSISPTLWLRLRRLIRITTERLGYDIAKGENGYSLSRIRNDRFQRLGRLEFLE